MEPHRSMCPRGYAFICANTPLNCTETEPIHRNFSPFTSTSNELLPSLSAGILSDRDTIDLLKVSNRPMKTEEIIKNVHAQHPIAWRGATDLNGRDIT
jgi:hypothetical protein